MNVTAARDARILSVVYILMKSEEQMQDRVEFVEKNTIRKALTE